MKSKLIALTLILLVSGAVRADSDIPMTKTNRLIHEKSPYLLQHANNPVDWYAWGEEAFQKAKDENKPIFLSIGYSTCHWCHVMEHESFEDAETAAILNQHFVSIKVDREERPDIDNIYMTAVMSMVGQGGWPLSVFLTPERKPFYGGTYFPPEPKWGSPGFKQLLLSIAENWNSKQAEIINSSDAITQAIEGRLSFEAADGASLDEATLKEAYESMASNFESRYGGFGTAPKFPMGHNLTFLLRYWKRTGEQKALDMVTKTLDEMAKGGMYDQLGGGFHRYSTDAIWQVPHFEKMLYDQALLVRAYLEAYLITEDENYADVARDILNYIFREMSSPKGGFYSAEDADSLEPEGGDEKKEGAFYLWSQKEVETHLDKGVAEVFKFYYGIEPNGNARQDPHGEFVGKNILFVAHSLEKTAKEFNMSVEDVRLALKKSGDLLLSVRAKRPRPHLDDKILTDWNGLMIAAMSFAAKVLGDEKYAESAKNAADFVMDNLIKDGRLLHRYREEAGILGHLEDYAFFVDGLIELYEATFEIKYLQEAVRLNDEMIRLFWDEEDGGFFFTADDAERLIMRQKEVYDGAIPSGNSVAAYNLIRLAKITLQNTFEAKAEHLMKTFAGQVQRRPSAYAQLMMALDFAMGPSYEIVLAGDMDDRLLQELARAVHAVYLPKKVLLHRPSSEKDAAGIIDLSSFIEAQKALEDLATAYVCRDYKCKRPVNSAQELTEQLLK